MACIINASTSAGLVQTADLSGVLQFQQNGVALPNGGVAPAFSAYQSSSQSIVTATFTKVQFQTEEFDTNNNFDNATNYRFTPTVAGYYQVTASVGCSSTVGGQSITSIYKNGSEFKRGIQIASNIPGVQTNTLASALISFNGSTDYVEAYVFQQSGVNQTTATGAAQTYFQACLVRGA